MISERSSQAKCAMVVGLTGCSRSGKSWIAGEVKRTLDAQGKKTSVVVGQDSFWVQSVMVKVGAQMRSSEEDPQCTDNEAFERAIRHEMLLHDVVIAEGFQVRRCAEPFSLRPLPAAEYVWQRDALACQAPAHAAVASKPHAHAQATVLWHVVASLTHLFSYSPPSLLPRSPAATLAKCGCSDGCHLLLDAGPRRGPHSSDSAEMSTQPQPTVDPRFRRVALAHSRVV
jgi:hypothetical protein